MRPLGTGTTITLSDEAGQRRPVQCAQEDQRPSKTSEEASLSSRCGETHNVSLSRDKQLQKHLGDRKKPQDVESWDVFLSNAEF